MRASSLRERGGIGPPMWKAVAAVVACLGFLASCSDPICGCTPVVTTAAVVVDGTVLDSASSPVPQAVVSSTGVLLAECSTAGHSMASQPDSVLTDSSGRFELVLMSDYGAGHHCVELVLRSPGMATPDTIHDIAADFRHIFELPDTVTVELLAGG